MAAILNPARDRLVKGELSLGVGIRMSRSIEVARMMKSCGFDWLFLDLEHGMLTLDTCSQMAIAALDAGISPIVRVPERQFDMAARALDGGAVLVVGGVVDGVGGDARSARDAKPAGVRLVRNDQRDFGRIIFCCRGIDQRRHVGTAAGDQNGDAFAAHHQARSSLPS